VIGACSKLRAVELRKRWIDGDSWESRRRIGPSSRVGPAGPRVAKIASVA